MATGPLWLSLTVDGEAFEEADRPALQPLLDWHIVASPPLVVENTLPIGGTYMIWESPEVCSYVRIKCLRFCSSLLLYTFTMWSDRWPRTQERALHGMLL